MNPFIIITGMHRSGTSFLARALNMYGVNLGSLESLISLFHVLTMNSKVNLMIGFHYIFLLLLLVHQS